MVPPLGGRTQGGELAWGQKGGHHFEGSRWVAEWCWEGSAGAVLAFKGAA